MTPPALGFGCSASAGLTYAAYGLLVMASRAPPTFGQQPHSAAQTPLDRTQSGPIRDRLERPNRQ
jgi:hypothetical protein